MKKRISFFLFGLFLCLNSWSTTALPENKPVKKALNIEKTNFKQDLVCASYDISCGSGFACANSLQEVDILITLIYLQFCVYGENPECNPKTVTT